MFEQVPFPQPSVRTDPGTIGVVQLPTWFWVGDSATSSGLTVGPLGVGGYSVVLHVHPVAYYWSFGDGTDAVSYTGGSGGGAASASVVHTYHQQGTYEVGLGIAWEGSYTFTGYGVDQTVPLGPVRQPAVVRSYRVQEVRSVLVQEGVT